MAGSLIIQGLFSASRQAGDTFGLVAVQFLHKIERPFYFKRSAVLAFTATRRRFHDR
jgi:hypothetical protein